MKLPVPPSFPLRPDFSVFRREFLSHSYAKQAEQSARNLSESYAAARLPDPHGDTGVYVSLSENGTTGFRNARARLRSGSAVRRAERSEALHLVVSQRRRFSRGGDEPHPRRSRRRDASALHAAHCTLLCARRHLHERRRAAREARMEARVVAGARRSARFAQRAMSAAISL